MAKNIVLIGIMGCGKTVVGMNIARLLDYKFVDVDAYIQNEEKRTIKEIFKDGEAAFREIEEATIKKLSVESDLIISTGGGAVLRENNVMNLKKNGIIFFINRPVETIASTVETAHRPLLANGPDALYKIFETRYPIYKNACDFEITGEKSIQETTGEIILKYKQSL